MKLESIFTLALCWMLASHTAAQETDDLGKQKPSYAKNEKELIREILTQKVPKGVFDKETGKPNIKLIRKRINGLKNHVLFWEDRKLLGRYSREFFPKHPRKSIERRLASFVDAKHSEIELFQMMAKLAITESQLAATKGRLEPKKSTAQSIKQFVADAERLLKKNELNNARVKFWAAILADKSNPTGLVARGDFYFKNGYYRLAAHDYYEAHQRSPQNRAALIGLAKVAIHLRDDKRVVWAGEAILRKNPKDAEALFFAGSGNFYLKNYKQSQSQLKKCIELDPKFAKARFALARTLERLGQLKLAIQSVTEAIEIEPHPAYYMLRSELHMSNLDYVQSQNDQEKSIRLFYQNNPKLAAYEAWEFTMMALYGFPR